MEASNFNYCEVLVETLRKRGVLTTLDRFYEQLIERGLEAPVYRSVFLYDEEGADSVRENKSPKDFIGPQWCDLVPVDIDLGQNTPEFTLSKARMWFQHLCDTGLDDDQIAIYFSGTGYHLFFSSDAFGIKPDPDYAYMLKETMNNLAKEGDLVIDQAVYSKTSVIRAEHTLNRKSGLFKIPLSKEELFMKNPDQIKELAKTQRVNFPSPEPGADGELARFVVRSVPEIRQLSSGKSRDRKEIATCMHSLYHEGPQEGSRNHVVLRLASFYRRQGIPPDAAKAILMRWNDGQLNPRIINEKVEAVYERGYQYGCNDPILKGKCVTSCMFYKHKNMHQVVKDSDDLQKELLERLGTDFTGRSINLSRALGHDSEVVLLPGDMLTIFGPSGSNKSTLTQNIVLGYDPVLDEIVSENTVSTLYLSLELPGHTMQRRSLQICADAPKSDFKKISNVREYYEQHKEKLSHLKVQHIPPTIQDIEAAINQHDFECVVVDYLDLMPSPHKDEYSQIRFVSHQLRNLATVKNKIIIQVSQVGREYSREKRLDMFAGKGSGAIENASSIVLGVWNPDKDNDKNPMRNIEMFKATDDDMISTRLFWTPSFRMKKEMAHG